MYIYIAFKKLFNNTCSRKQKALQELFSQFFDNFSPFRSIVITSNLRQNEIQNNLGAYRQA